MTLSANGLIAQADETHQISPEVLGDFVQQVKRAGNVIVGRRTFELMSAQTSQGAFPGIETVVVTRSGLRIDGVNVAASPQQALELLERKGHEAALIGGGATLDASFLSQGLVDEIYLNIESILTSKGLALDFDTGVAVDMQLTGSAQLSENVVQLHYDVSGQEIS